MGRIRIGWWLTFLPALGAAPLGQSVELTRPLARGNLHRGTAELSRDGRWAVFSGRYSSSGPGINSLYAVASDGSSAPFLLYDHGDIPGVAREFDPGTVTFVHVTPDSHRAVFTVDERGSIYSAYLAGERWILPAHQSVDRFIRLAQADTSRDFQLAPDGSRAVFFGFNGLHSVPVNGGAPAVEIVPQEYDGTFAHRVQAFAIDATSTRVVFTLGNDGVPIPRRLASVPIDGSEPPTLLSPHLVRRYAGTPPDGAPGDDLQGRVVTDFQLAPAGGTVLSSSRTSTSSRSTAAPPRGGWPAATCAMRPSRPTRRAWSTAWPCRAADPRRSSHTRWTGAPPRCGCTSRRTRSRA